MPKSQPTHSFRSLSRRRPRATLMARSAVSSTRLTSSAETYSRRSTRRSALSLRSSCARRCSPETTWCVCSVPDHSMTKANSTSTLAVRAKRLLAVAPLPSPHLVASATLCLRKRVAPTRDPSREPQALQPAPCSRRTLTCGREAAGSL